ncbi:hypothetical protein KP05_12180 [Cobetia amphilecti]|uniref:DUF1330 domain-containing protein n=1 Tax=Cobetia TaxID=204286 RepID=UPI0005049E68|nr:MULTISPECIES: DUF1330 domain-containing protein [Cobetia]KGA01544.1 hypothetical protein KP05_12180 [Cobetia amphilecti]MDH2297249.1 DUF1330 domain-containing protein [Cobetia sp. 29-18-1]
MAYYSVIDVTPTSTEWMADYAGPAHSALARHGGRYLARTSQHEWLEGEGLAAVSRVIIEWPSREAALAFMQDPEYRPALEARTAGSVSHHVLVKGLD